MPLRPTALFGWTKANGRPATRARAIFLAGRDDVVEAVAQIDARRPAHGLRIPRGWVRPPAYVGRRPTGEAVAAQGGNRRRPRTSTAAIQIAKEPARRAGMSQRTRVQAYPIRASQSTLRIGPRRRRRPPNGCGGCRASSWTAARSAAKGSTGSRCCRSLRSRHRVKTLLPAQLRSAARLPGLSPQQEGQNDASSGSLDAGLSRWPPHRYAQRLRVWPPRPLAKPRRRPSHACQPSVAATFLPFPCPYPAGAPSSHHADSDTIPNRPRCGRPPRSAAKFNWVLSRRLPVDLSVAEASLSEADAIKPYTL